MLRTSLLRAMASALALAGPFSIGPLRAEPNAGAYLAGRIAAADNEFLAAADYFQLALQGDPDNPSLLENALVSLAGAADLDTAVELAERLAGLGLQSQVGGLVLIAAEARNGDWDDLIARLEAGPQVSQLVDGLSLAWALAGKGDMTRSLAAFDAVIQTPSLGGIGLYHKALALASVGDFEGADAILSMTREAGMPRTRRATMAHAMVLSQLGRNDEAIERIVAVFGPDPDPILGDLIERLSEGEALTFTLAPSASDGIAELYFTVAAMIQADAPPEFTLVHSRIAEWLSPGHVEAILVSGQVLDQLGQLALSVSTYERVPGDNSAHFAAEMGRADAYRRAGETEVAAEILAGLADEYPDHPLVQSAYADILRILKRDDEAIAAYTRAIELAGPDNPAAWFAHFARAICLHRIDDWPAAEADFRRALELRPNHPQVLNYLGYSLVERREKLTEALEMIERAVAAEPQNGAIVDSLAWALFRLGRYAEALPHMERAAELEPVDPVVNDHLGDVYWAVGRHREARFQWSRALSFGPEEEEADRIRRKLEVGLDLVLSEEGADPLHSGGG